MDPQHPSYEEGADICALPFDDYRAYACVLGLTFGGVIDEYVLFENVKNMQGNPNLVIGELWYCHEGSPMRRSRLYHTTYLKVADGYLFTDGELYVLRSKRGEG